MATVSCIDCDVTMDDVRRDKKRCTRCRQRANHSTTRWLGPGEAIPAGPPRRRVVQQGYVQLLWHTGPWEYVATYEHRVVDGRITTAEHVHHINRDRADNRPENLVYLSGDEHRREHAEAPWHSEAARLYALGYSTPQIGRMLNRNHASVYRRLVKMGVPIRSELAFNARRRNVS